ncbi:hypothetical protein D9615_007565 [Tricholomella constricta]|uniref:Uncharacterized protein n=1 Tax=Tricholomella constricta TaxID=117010 RepID=A0A8H5H812_9AGAR|nr:hypothetical protein D9615_007565 [Tricholomella constricta]
MRFSRVSTSCQVTGHDADGVLLKEVKSSHTGSPSPTCLTYTPRSKGLLLPSEAQIPAQARASLRRYPRPPRPAYPPLLLRLRRRPPPAPGRGTILALAPTHKVPPIPGVHRLTADFPSAPGPATALIDRRLSHGQIDVILSDLAPPSSSSFSIRGEHPLARVEASLARRPRASAEPVVDATRSTPGHAALPHLINTLQPLFHDVRYLLLKTCAQPHTNVAYFFVRAGRARDGVRPTLA